MGKFDDLPNDIIPEILSRLPAESALECKLVCKPWRDLVRHPTFSRMHLNHVNSSNNSGKLSFIFLSGESANEFYYTDYDENCNEGPFNKRTRMNLNLPLEDYAYSFAGSCNGLICFDTFTDCDDSYCGPTFICNPITREYIVLQKFEEKFWYTGFGFSSSTNEYKAVRICYSSIDSDVGIVLVYTLGSGTGWRNAGTFEANIEGVSTGAFANGALHWANDKGTILSFNLTDEKFSELPSPPFLTGFVDSDFVLTIGVLGDSLSATYYSHSDSACEIWLLKKNKDSYTDLRWSKEFTFDRCMSRLVGFTKSGRLLYNMRGKIFCYDPKVSSAEMDLSFGKSIYETIPHKNTFISLKVLGEKDTQTMESGGRASSSENDKLKKPQNEESDL